MTRPFTSEVLTRRMERAAAQATDAGLTGVLVTPGPDLIYFTGYQPVAITERITMLVLQASRDPSMIVPILERPDAAAAPGAAALSLTDWADAATRTPPLPGCSARTAATPSRTRPGPCTCLVCNRRCPSPSTCR
jgi:Xaa-Pro aminopeptidase